MEGLVSSGINTVRVFGITKHQSRFLPSSTLHLRNNSVCGFGIGVEKKKKKQCFVVAASVGGSKVVHFENTLPSKEVLELWRNGDAVCFDVDSTVCLDEGIDELAEFCGAGKAVAEWTARAMGGSVPFEEALAARLSLFNPSLSQLQDFLEQKPPRLSPGIEELVQKLKANGIVVYLISGGFRQMINPVASILGIPQENIFANQLLFRSSGEFLGFDKNEPTSRSGGKAVAVQQIKKAHGFKTLTMVGDGATDFEARRPGGADMFVCYAGVQLRESVAAKADWLVFSFKDLINSLGFVCRVLGGSLLALRTCIFVLLFHRRGR
ncbi:Phosphoserine phosphatase, chloroplastic [Glycine max]|nr:Phosphoserine phosphatase, chloroplastic [Glycine max]